MKTIWRIGAKVVAVIGLIVHLFHMTLILVYAFLEGESVYLDTTPENYNNKPVEWITLTLLIIIAVAVTLIEMVADKNLLEAAQPGMELGESLKKVRYWQSVAVVFFTMFTVLSIIRLSVISLLTTIAFRGAHIFVVYKFKQEILYIINSPSRQCYETLT